MSRVSNLSRELSSWVDGNPLRKWRAGATERITQATVAAVVRRSAQAVRDYESGSYRPEEEVMDGLADLIGVAPKTLKKRWTEWMDQRPEAA